MDLLLGENEEEKNDLLEKSKSPREDDVFDFDFNVKHESKKRIKFWILSEIYLSFDNA